MLPEKFLEKIVEKHRTTEVYPPTSSVSRFVTRLILTLFPEQTRRHFQTMEDLKLAFEKYEEELFIILHSMQTHLKNSPEKLSAAFMAEIPAIYDLLNHDVHAILHGDPAAKSEYEVVRAYPGFYAIAFYRMAHVLYRLDIPLLPRVLTEYAHSKTGIDIHPGAEIGAHFFIDHGTGITIGETAVIGEHVKIYQGVTLGALSVSKEMASLKRHPTIHDHVVIYSGSTILGGETEIGSHCIIGGNVWLTESLPPHTKVYHQEQIRILVNK